MQLKYYLQVLLNIPRRSPTYLKKAQNNPTQGQNKLRIYLDDCAPWIVFEDELSYFCLHIYPSIAAATKCSSIALNTVSLSDVKGIIF